VKKEGEPSTQRGRKEKEEEKGKLTISDRTPISSRRKEEQGKKETREEKKNLRKERGRGSRLAARSFACPTNIWRGKRKKQLRRRI